MGERPSVKINSEISLQVKTIVMKGENMSEPLISIVLCTYNGERYLQEQVESLLRQTYSHFEIIIADDCSTDGTQALLAQWQNHEKITLLFNTVNVGYTKNFEQAALHANGDLISFCDQDDIWMPTKLERLKENIAGYSAVFSDSILINETGEELGVKLSDLRKLQSIFDTRSLAFQNMVSGHTMMVDREIIKKAFPIPEGEYHDWWMAAVAASACGIFYLDEPLTCYRQHEKTVTTNIITKKELKARTRQRRYKDYQRDIAWLKNVIRVSKPGDARYLNRFLQLYQKRVKGHYVWPLFFLLLREKAVVFRYSNKKLLSQIFELRKMARGESAV